MIIHLTLVFSNLLGLLPLTRAYYKSSIIDVVLIPIVMGFSFLMHISETKHRLNPYFLKNFSQLLLNMDRIMSYTCGSYYTYRFILLDRSNQEIILPVFLLGAVCSRIGEMKFDSLVFNYFYYPILHSIWHFSIYFSLNYIV